MLSPRQRPAPGERLVRWAGDEITFLLEHDGPSEGGVFLRTTLGRGQDIRREIIQRVEGGPAVPSPWRDLPMQADGPGRWTLTMPLTEVGHFEAKALVIPAVGEEPLWPEGEGNAVLNVEPAQTAAANSIYAAFPRLFGRGKEAKKRRKVDPNRDERVKELDAEGYSVIPPSGTLRDVAKELGHVFGALGFRWLLLLPIFPTPTTFARMGRFGSPFAARDFFAVDPALAEFDATATPLDQFRELADAVHARGGRLMLDVPINHTGWASRLQELHPEWFARADDGKFRSPGAWGVVWADLVELTYEDRALWKEMAEVFLFWLRQGADGFRCDAGYMVPAPVWTYIVAKAREEFPDAVFLLEGLGGKLEVTAQLLDDANMNWAYSELFQEHDRGAIEWGLPKALTLSSTRGLTVHFAETHDNNRLAATSPAWSKLRAALAALCSPSGAWGVTCGAEWFADEKIDVHDVSGLHWGSSANQLAEIARLNEILRDEPAFHAGAQIELIQTGQGNGLAVKRTPAEGESILVLINLDAEAAQTIHWPSAKWNADHAIDLLTLRKIDDCSGSHTLSPGEVLCLSRRPSPRTVGMSRQDQQRWRQAVRALPLSGDSDSLTATELRTRLREASGQRYAPALEWRFPEDTKRIVVVPSGHFLHCHSPLPFRLRLQSPNRASTFESLPLHDGGHAAILRLEEPGRHAYELTAFDPRETRRVVGEWLVPSPMEQALTVWRGLEPTWPRLPAKKPPKLEAWATQESTPAAQLHAVLGNGRGGMSQVRAAFGQVMSQYDSLLAANLHPDFPVDRQVMFTRCRAWIRWRGYSTEINAESLLSFGTDCSAAEWAFSVGLGERRLELRCRLELHEGENRCSLTFTPSDSISAFSCDDPPTLILRPDIEDRNFHHKTARWESAARRVQTSERGFLFRPNPARHLAVEINRGDFHAQPEWLTVSHPLDAERGLGAHSDLFSPGFFSAKLLTEGVVLEAKAFDPNVPEAGNLRQDLQAGSLGNIGNLPLAQAALRSMRAFLVKRDDSRTVIAGYPWFLDWGRDTFIFLRGAIAAGWLEETRDITRQFARFERQGTLPNMIRGGDDSNRDTSDAPLWFVLNCRDLTAALGDARWLDEDTGRGRTTREALSSIVRHYISGTPNGIRMDQDSGLIFSPSHFTWMDTNHPAGSPREGYPIEIQALWRAALLWSASLLAEPDWAALANRVRRSLESLFWREAEGFYSDCLHGPPGTSARDAVADDHLRPNQLLAITLGAVEDLGRAERALHACASLVVPGAIRTLADRPVKHPLRVERHGQLLNDPARPYFGQYLGDEDTRRKPAYHNGTAWCWPFPSYPEALFRVYGEEAREAARALLQSSATMWNQDCLGHLPEIADGDAPHRPRGCGAQAWSASEWYRVHALLSA